MKRRKIAQQLIGVILLSMMVSCMRPPNQVNSLKGQIYLNEQTKDRMEFTDKNTVVITWLSDVLSPLGYYQRNQPYEFQYEIDNGSIISIVCPTSSEGLSFPYRNIGILVSKNKIIVTNRRDGSTVAFKRIN